MSWSTTCRALILATLVLLGGLVSMLPTAWAQKQIAVPIGAKRPVAPPTTTSTGDPTDLGGITVTPDEGLKTSLEKKIRRANDNIEIQDWKEAVEALQELLERPEDVFIAIERQGPGGEVTRSIASVRAEATRMVGNLPKPGLEFYRLTYGPQAAGALATANGDPEILASIMQRYLYTDAGAEATEQLATYLLDRGRYSAAALCFERLFQRQGPEKLSGNTLFKAALAFHHVGDRNNNERAWKFIEGQGGDDGTLKLGDDRAIPIVDLKSWVAKRPTEGGRRERYDWLMAGGGPTRSDQGDGTTAFLEPRWSHETIKEPQTKGYMDRALQLLEQNKQPALHSFAPLAVTLNREEGKVPLMVYRSTWGLHARVVRKTNLSKDEEYEAGELYWEAPSGWSLDKMVRDPRHVGALQSWISMYVDNRVKPQVLFENSVTGSLSTDGVRVYAVEDFQVPPYFNQAQFGGNRPTGNFEQKLEESLHHSRLQAFELDSGKLLWEVGSKAEGPKPGDLENTYFLSAPLPLNGKLYVLTEREQELRLVCLDATTGKLVGRPQRLADAREKILVDINRRLHASHLAYGEGILVCPTNSGGMLGVDLLTNSLVWAYGYRDRAATTALPAFDPRFGQAPPGQMWTPEGRLVPIPVSSGYRVTTPPVVVQGKVVFTASDAHSIHCLHLRDGGRVWKTACQDNDLYVAGVHAERVIVVGKNYCRGLSMVDGAEVWRVETGIPSGVGIASKDIFYLPIKESTKSREPGICLIDIAKGTLLATTQSRKKEIPGNLLFYEGDVLSQTLTRVAVYPQLEVELKRVDALLAQNATDPVGLARRGDLRLDKGDLAGAIADLQGALKQQEKLEAGIATKAKEKLYDSMTEYLQKDFDGAEKYLAEYEAMCRTGPLGTPEARSEERRRLGNFYCLLGKGREQQALRSTGAEAQRKLIEAFEAYMSFGTLGATEGELMGVVDDPGVKAAPAVWSRGRIAAMVAQADQQTRAPLEALIAKRWQRVQQSGNLDEMRGFVSTFGSFSSVGREAALFLAEKLINEADPKTLVECEKYLNQLRGQKEDTTMAGRAVEALARLMTRRGLMEDATYYYRVLGRDFTKVTIKDGKTGQDFYNDLATDKRLLAFLDEPTPLFGARPAYDRTREISESKPYNLSFRLGQEGENLPFFQRHEIAVRADGLPQFRVIDRESEADFWTLNLDNGKLGQLGNYLRNYNAPQLSPRLTFKNTGHLVVLQLGHMVYGFDPINKSQLWEKNLSTSAQPQYRSHVIDNRDNSLRIVYADGWMQRLGESGPLAPSALCVVTSDSLMAMDPVSGQLLWSRNDMPRKCHFLCDDQYVYVIEVDEQNVAGATRIFRLHDGVGVRARDFSALYQKRIRMQGRQLLVSDSDARNVILRLHDVITGNDLWKMTFPTGSQVLQSEDRELAGAVEPDGKLTIVNLKTGQPILQGQMDKAHLEKMVSLHLLGDRDYLYVACNGQPDQEVMVNTMMSNLMPGSGLRALPINGMLYCFQRQGGRLNWRIEAANQMVVLDEFEDLPMVQLTARYQRRLDQFGRSTQVVAYRSHDKKSGKLLFDTPENSSNLPQFHDLKVDLRNRKVELIGPNKKIVHDLDPHARNRDDASKEGKTSQAPVRPGTGPVAAPVPPGRIIRGGVALPRQRVLPAVIID